MPSITRNIRCRRPVMSRRLSDKPNRHLMCLRKTAGIGLPLIFDVRCLQ